jgi:hypothetical protein
VRSVTSGMVAGRAWSTSRILGWDRPNSREISRLLLHVFRSTAAVYFDWLASVWSVGDLHPRVPLVLHFTCHGDAARNTASG